MFNTNVTKPRASNVDDLGATLQMMLESVPADFIALEFTYSPPSRGSIEIVNSNIKLVFSESIVAGHGNRNIVISNDSDIRTIAMLDASQVYFI